MPDMPAATMRPQDVEAMLTAHAECITSLQAIAKQNRQSIVDQGEAIEEIAVAVMGSRRSQLAGGGREDDGVIDRLERMERHMNNGGLKVHIPKWLTVTVITTVGSLFGVIIVAIVEHVV
jgi:hypothetical protein